MALHRKLFGERIEFESEFNGLTCLSADLHRPNAVVDTKLAQYAAQFVDFMHDVGQVSTVQEVRKAIYLLLPLGNASMARVAGSLGLHERTLQRRLVASGAEFSICSMASATNLPNAIFQIVPFSLTRVAAMLGYAQPSSFTRWFIGEFGASPSVWRSSNPPTSAILR